MNNSDFKELLKSMHNDMMVNLAALKFMLDKIEFIDSVDYMVEDYLRTAIRSSESAIEAIKKAINT